MVNDDIAQIRKDLRKYIIYSRKSKFTGKGESVENQIEICKAYIKSKFDINVKDDDIIIKQDEGFSGKDVNRPQFQEMMNLVKNKQIKIIVVYKLDRLSRNVLDFCEMYNELERYGTKFVSVSESFDTTTSIGRAMLMITMTFAQLERETIADRIRDNMLELAKTGRWLGGNTPMGFCSEKMDKFNINGKKVSLFRLCPIEDELEVIRLIYGKYLEFKSLTALEEFLLNSNLRTRRECDFTRWSLKKILTNPVYAVADIDMFKYFKKNSMDVFNEENDWDGTYGVMSYNKTGKTKNGSVRNKDKSQWINAIGRHKGVIRGIDWIDVQKLLNNNTNKAYRKPTKNNAILAGILRCEYCGNLMRPKLKDILLSNGDRKFNYICDLKMRSRGKKCSCPNINGNDADRLVLNGMKQLAKSTSEFYQELVKEIKRENYGKSIQSNELVVLEKKHRQNLSSIKNYISRLECVDEELLEDVQKKIKDIKQKDKGIVAKIQELKTKMLKPYVGQEKERMVSYILDNYINNFTELDLLSKRNFLKLFISSCSTDGKNIHIDLLGTSSRSVFDSVKDSDVSIHDDRIVLLGDSRE